MAYRTPARGAHDAEMACEACGESIVVRTAEREDVTCRRCGRHQSSHRETIALERIELIHAGVPKGYDHLTPFLQELSPRAPGGSVALTVRADGLSCTVSLALNSGTVMGIDLVAHAPAALPHVRLVPERKSHTKAKAKGVAIEVQTGDAEFDEAVYVESDAPAAEVQAFLAPPAVRRAAMQLLAIAKAVEIGAPGPKPRVSVTIPSTNLAPSYITEHLAAVRVLAGAPRALVRGAPAVAVRIARTNAALWLTTLASVPLFLTGLFEFRPVNGAFVGPVAFPALVVALLLQLVLVPLLRGRSTSHRNIRVARVQLLVALPLLALGLTLIANGALDRSGERIVEMAVSSTSKDSDDRIWVHTRDPAGHRHSYEASTDAVRRVQAYWRDGALGIPWEEHTPTLFTTP